MSRLSKSTIDGSRGAAHEDHETTEKRSTLIPQIMEPVQHEEDTVLTQLWQIKDKSGHRPDDVIYVVVDQLTD